MKTVKSIEKKAKGYDVTFGVETIRIEPDLMVKYHLKLQDELDEKTYQNLIVENEYLYYQKLGIAKLKRMMTIHEMKAYLSLKGAKDVIIKQLIHDFIKKKYLDDVQYAKLYTQLKKTTDGPKAIENKLREKGISKEIVDQMTSQIDEPFILKESLPKKMASIKNKSKKQMIQTLKGYYLRKGFSLDAVDQVIKKNLSSYQVNEIDLIKKEAQKLMKKYKDKVEAKELNYFVTQKLYAKGFKIEDIKKVIG